ncbi:MAG: putative vacuolar amino acid transporter, partial [Streblomastix strix]
MHSINEESGEPEKKQSYNRFPTAIISLVNSHLGAGMLGIPLAYAKAGLVPAIIMHILMGLISWFSFYFLTYSSEATGQYSYGDLAEKIFGIGGTIVVEICNFSYTFLPLWAYLILIGDFIPSLLRMMGVDESNIFCQRWFIILIVGFFVLQPLSWFRTLNSLKYFSSLGMFSMMLTVIVMIIRFFSPFNEEVDHTHIQVLRPSFSIIQTFSALCFAFGCQQNVPIIHSEIKERSTKKMNYINLWAILIVGIFYMFAGVFGYISFTQLFFDNKTTSGNLLTLYADKDPLAVVARIASLITVLFCCPMNSLPAHEHDQQEEKDVTKERINNNETEKQKENLEQKEQPQQEKDNDWWTSNKIGPFTYDFLRSCLVGSIMIWIVIVLAIVLSQVNFVFDILGSTGGVAVGFMIPALMFWKIIRNPNRFVDAKRKCYSKTPEGIAE